MIRKSMVFVFPLFIGISCVVKKKCFQIVGKSGGKCFKVGIFVVFLC